MEKILKWLQFTNIYIAICAVSSAIANVKLLQLHKTPILLFAIIGISVIWFYNLSYQNTTSKTNLNERTIWFLKNRKQLFTVQTVLLSCTAIFSMLLLPNLFAFFTFTNSLQQIFILSFIVLGLWYNLGLINKNNNFSIRQIPFLKPFIIGYVWLGVTLVFPFTFNLISAQKTLVFTNQFWLFFFDGLLTISLLAILYDVKDFVADTLVSLKTWANTLGAVKLSRLIIFPVSIGAILLLIILCSLGFLSLKLMFILTLPYLLIVITSLFIHINKSIIWHLTVIDGIILVKALLILLLNN